MILIDNEAGLEHVSCYRLNRIDLFQLVLTPGRSSWQVGNRISDTAAEIGLSIGESWQLYNGVYENSRLGTPGPQTLLLPECPTLVALDRQDGRVHALTGNHLLRLALAPLTQQILTAAALARQTVIPFSRLTATGGESLSEIEVELQPFGQPALGA